MTYGKSSRNVKAWSLDSLNDDELSRPTPKPAIEKTPPVRETYTITKNETKTHALKPIKRREKKQDAWDVPSSDDEEEVEPVRWKSPTKLVSGRRHAVEHVQKTEQKEELAPWEKRKAAESQSEQEDRRRKKHLPLTSDTQLMSELTYSLSHERKASQMTGPTQPAIASPAKMSSPAPSSAAARLRAKKLLKGKAPVSDTDDILGQKRPGLDATTAVQSPRKKLKADDSPKDDGMDIVMDDAPERPACEHPQVVIQPSAGKPDVYDLPDSSADELAKTKPLPAAARRKLAGKPCGGKLMTYSRSSPRKMDSAPARLSDMLSNDIESTDATSSAANSPPTTPPKSSRVATPETAFKHAGTMTPKQARLWDQLLESETSATTPQVLAIQDLTLNTRRVPKTTNAVPRNLAKSSSDVGPRPRSKLVDRLKASAPSSDVESSDESGDEPTDTDVEMQDDDDTAPAEVPSSQQSQSQSQSQTQRTSGPKVTYASRTRSHLPEDSLEDGLMFSLTSETPQRKTPVSRQISTKSNAASQKSAFDMDNSEDDEQTGRIQTIHELRAGGVNTRFINDIGGLLEDIADHNISARSRRRTGMIELASKLADATFAEKFLRQGYEQQLLAELNAARDDVADFALASAFATMLSHEIPAHVAPSLRDGGLLPWLGELLPMHVDPLKMAKDRKNNMSKSAQRSFAAFVEALKGRELVWGETKPGHLPSRTISLKVIDKLIGKLRRSGDRSELVGVNEIRKLAPEEGELTEHAELPFDVTLSISALEALSTTAVSLAWPSDVVEKLRTVLNHPSVSSGNPHDLRFLSLRLCLNLTNENARNCKILSKPPTVAHLLRAMNEGFGNLRADVPDEQRTINLDLLVLSMGILINLTEHNDSAREQATTAEAGPCLSSLVDVFQVGQQRLIEAESVEQGATNVAYGYLAVVLANLCRNREAKAFIASKLPGKNLSALVDGLAEFVLQHQKVDTIALEGEEGMEVWRAFTEKLKEVLRRLQAEAEMV